jgi:hypothetical protein
MNKQEHTRRAQQIETLASMGYTYEEAEKLAAISRRLRRWYARECGTDGGAIERDETTGRPFWVTYCERTGARRRYPVADQERGALKRLAALARHPYYLQTDPRGAALYLLREGDVPEGQSAESYYSRGVCVY